MTKAVGLRTNLRPKTSFQLAPILLEVANQINVLHAVSFQRFTNDIRLGQVRSGWGPVGLERELNSLAQILAGLVESGSLGIGSRKFFRECPIPFGYLPKHGCKLKLHSHMLRSRLLRSVIAYA